MSDIVERLRDRSDPMTNEMMELAAAEIERLRNGLESADRVANDWARQNVELRTEIERLRDELRERLSQDILDDALEEWKKENERLREENALLTKGWQPATPTALLDEIKRLRAMLYDLLAEVELPQSIEKRVREALGERDD